MWNSLTIPWHFPNSSRHSAHVKCYSYHVRTSVIVSGGGRNATVHDPKTKQNKTHKLAWSPSIHPSMFISPKHQIRYRQHTLASVTKINRRGHRQMQYSETRPALQCDCMRQWTCELQQCLRSRDDRQRRHMPVAATSEGVGDRPPSTQDFKGSYYLRDPAVSTSTFRQSLKTHLFSAYQHV